MDWSQAVFSLYGFMSFMILAVIPTIVILLILRGAVTQGKKFARSFKS